METDYTLKLLIEAQDKFSSTFNSTISTLKKSVAGLGLSLSALGTIKGITKLADNLEQSQIAFTTMLGSGERAKAMLQDLSDFAKKTPFELTGIRQNAQQLIAMGVSANDIIPTLKSLGDVSAGLSVPLERLALNYGQVISQGKLTGRELRDFTMAGVPLLDELSQMLGKTTSQIQDMISKGQISSNDVVQAFQNMSSEGGRFADLMSQQATTLTGLRSNFQDSLNLLGEEIGMELLPSLKDYTAQLGKWLDDNADSIKKVAKEIIETAKVVADNVVGFLGDLGNAFTTFAGFVNDISQGIADSTANSMTESSSTTAQGLTGMMGNRHDFFYYVQQGISGIVGALRTALNTANTLVKTIGKKSFWNGLNEAGKVSSKTVEKGNNIFGTIGNRFSEQKRQLSESASGMKDYLSTALKPVEDAWNDGLDETYQTLENNYVKQVDNLTSAVYSANQTVSNAVSSLKLDDVLGGGDTASSGSSSAEKMSDEMKDLIKEMENYAKETVEMKKATYEGIIDTMEEAVKKAESLSKEIVNLKEELDTLNQSETQDIAEAYVKAEEKLAEMEREHENIGRIASRYTEDILKTYKSNDELGGYSVKDLETYIDLQNQLKSAYAGLTEEQTKSLDEQIKKQQEYNALNDIEKIKYDYEQKRAVIQADIEEKQQLLQQELDAFQKASEKKTEYEKNWLDYMKYSYKEQTAMNEQMIKQLQRIIALRQEAGMSSGTAGRRAGGGVVYGGETYLVGENGPELFTPSQRGMITPNNQITNNNGIEINISGVSVRNDDDINALANEIVRQIKLEKDFGIA